MSFECGNCGESDCPICAPGVSDPIIPPPPRVPDTIRAEPIESIAEERRRRKAADTLIAVELRGLRTRIDLLVEGDRDRADEARALKQDVRQLNANMLQVLQRDAQRGSDAGKRSGRVAGASWGALVSALVTLAALAAKAWGVDVGLP